MPDVPWWGIASSAAAPVLLVGGWTLAEGLQPQSFDPVSDTVSGLMAVGATDRWVMTTALLAVGICYIVTGAALRPARRTGRLILIAGAAAGMMVAAYPQPAGGGGPVWHAIWATLGFAGLAGQPGHGGAVHRYPRACGREPALAPSLSSFSCWRGSSRNCSPGPGRPA